MRKLILLALGIGALQDALGNAIPFEQRTQDDQDLARGGVTPAFRK
jgi:hypothetical protein